MESVTPAQLALELQVTQKQIRDFLRSVHGVLSDGETRWRLDADQADQVRANFRSKPGQSGHGWGLEPGDTVRRRAIHETYAGQQQGGIATPVSAPEIFIFTDPDAGAKYGYDKFEGLREDGTYAYTGEGQLGPQVFVRGNRALRDAEIDNKTIRLFRTKGVNATYVGSFALGTPPYFLEQIPDVNGNPREGIIFNLEPIDAEVDLLPAYGGGLEPAGELVSYAMTPRAWSRPESTDVRIAASSEPAQERTMSRVELALQSDFGDWVISQGATPQRLPLRAGNTIIEPDMFVPERNWIVEAKRSISRGHVRTAIGQVLDYVHMAAKGGLQADPVILLPGEPEKELQELMAKLGIVIIARRNETFEILTPSKAE